MKDLDACALVRLFVPHLHTPNSVFIFHREGFDMTPFKDAQVAVVQRLCSRDNHTAMMLMKRQGMKIIYDLDDNMWNIPSYNIAHDIFRAMAPGFQVCASEADLVTVSTEPLKIAARNSLTMKGRRPPRIEVVTNAMDFELVKPLPPEQRKPKNGRVIVGWAGTNTHVGDVGTVFAMLARILGSLPQMELEFVGLPPPVSISGHPRVRVRNFVPVAEFPARWASWDWDVSLAPLEDNKFNRGKSNLKMVEAAALSIPCLVSDVAPYRDFCAHSELLKKHVLCRTLTDWERKLRAVVSDAALRLELGTEMRRVGGFYDIRETIKRWHALMEEL